MAVPGRPVGLTRLPVVRQPAWFPLAACVGRDDVDFFDGPPGPALAVCAACPVVAECGEWAAELNIRFGVFGGRTAQERRREWGRERRRRAKSRAGVSGS